MKSASLTPRPALDTLGMVEFICAYNRVFTEAKLEHRGPGGAGFLTLEERDLAERAYLAGTTPEMFALAVIDARKAAAAPSIVALPGGQHMGFGAVVRALREKAKCEACDKTTLVFDVSAVPLERRSRTSMFRPERVSVETHCACPGGPAHHLLQQAVAS